MTTTAATWMPVLVRLEHYTQVAEYVASLETNRPRADAADTAPAAVTIQGSPAQAADDRDSLGRPVWAVEDLKRLAAGSTTTTQRWTQAMDVCAQAPGTYFSSSEIAQRTGMDIEEWRSAARQITRHLAKHYTEVPLWDGHAVWPLYARTRSEHPGQVSWTISPEMADLWRQARDA